MGGRGGRGLCGAEHISGKADGGKSVGWGWLKMNSALPFPCCRWGRWAAAPYRKGRVVQRSWWPLSHSKKEEEVVLNSYLF